MAIDSDIQYIDSSINIQMGCEGCELVKGLERPVCYAKTLTDRYAGLKGWPEYFEKPKIFPERIKRVLSWPDLTNKSRPTKQWLSYLPRVVFLNDMGDTFTKGLPPDWFSEFLSAIASSPHIYLVLTKWPQRFAEFSKKYEIPPNIWPGTSITGTKTAFRVKHLAQIKGGGIKWISYEPMWEFIDLCNVEGISAVNWVCMGGASGHDAAPVNVFWFEENIKFCERNNIAPFVKQLGTYLSKQFNLKDGHGGDMKEWPDSIAHLKVRKMPAATKEELLYLKILKEI